MHDTLKNFGYPKSVIKEYQRWVVLIRPEQLTFGSVVIASKSEEYSFSDLTKRDIVELPSVIADVEKVIRPTFNAVKFN